MHRITHKLPTKNNFRQIGSDDEIKSEMAEKCQLEWINISYYGMKPNLKYWHIQWILFTSDTHTHTHTTDIDIRHRKIEMSHICITHVTSVYTVLMWWSHCIRCVLLTMLLWRPILYGQIGILYRITIWQSNLFADTRIILSAHKSTLLLESFIRNRVICISRNNQRQWIRLEMILKSAMCDLLHTHI